MALKFGKSRVRLWKGTAKSGDSNIGIRFNKDKTEREFKEIYNAVKTVLTLKYGKGQE